MKCNNCGKEMNGGFLFCHECGSPLRDEGEQRFLDDTHRFLRYERVSWRIASIVWMVLGGLFAVVAVLLGRLVTVDGGGVFTVTYLFVASMYFAVAIVNIKLKNRVDWYLERMYTEPETVLERAESIGMIVLCAIFNEIAAIFYIINFVRMKTNRPTVERIKNRA